MLFFGGIVLGACDPMLCLFHAGSVSGGGGGVYTDFVMTTVASEVGQLRHQFGLVSLSFFFWGLGGSHRFQPYATPQP